MFFQQSASLWQQFFSHFVFLQSAIQLSPLYQAQFNTEYLWASLFSALMLFLTQSLTKALKSNEQNKTKQYTKNLAELNLQGFIFLVIYPPITFKMRVIGIAVIVCGLWVSRKRNCRQIHRITGFISYYT